MTLRRMYNTTVSSEIESLRLQALTDLNTSQNNFQNIQNKLRTILTLTLIYTKKKLSNTKILQQILSNTIRLILHQAAERRIELNTINSQNY